MFLHTCFEADYAGRERLSDAGESGTIVPLFSSTASISSTAFEVCMNMNIRDRSFQRRRVVSMETTCHLFDAPGGCR